MLGQEIALELAKSAALATGAGTLMYALVVLTDNVRGHRPLEALKAIALGGTGIVVSGALIRWGLS